MQGFRYHVVATQQGETDDPLQPSIARDQQGVQAGFQSVTIPELSIEMSEYREGIFKWTQKFPGIATVSDVTLMRGVVQQDTSFYDMVMASIEGDEYRCEVTIYQYHRTELGDAIAARGAVSGRRTVCHECFATRAKPNGDLDSTAGDVSMAEVDLCMESFELIYNGTEGKASAG
jgi:phage tail-like protein